MNVKVPFWTYLGEYKKNRQSILGAVDRAILSGSIILGQNVTRFEEKFAEYCSCTYGIGVNNGTDALFLAMKALGIGTGDEVITVPNTAIPTVSAIVAAGATPVFTDIDSATMLMDPSGLEKAITKRTKCVIPVHLYGNTCDMDPLMSVAKKYSLKVLEDCAQAAGATYKGKKVGSYGDIAAFSFYPTKIIGAYGDAGMIVTNDKSLAGTVRSLRMYGTRGQYYSYVSGYNSRLDEIQAAILLWKLSRIEKYIQIRENIAQRYFLGLSDTPLLLPKIKNNVRHVWHLFVVRHQLADTVMKKMSGKGFPLGVHYRFPLHTQDAYRYLGYKRGDFPAAEKAADSVISLPIYPDLSVHDQNRIILALKKTLQEVG